MYSDQFYIHSVWCYTGWVILRTPGDFTHSVWYYTKCLILHHVCPIYAVLSQIQFCHNLRVLGVYVEKMTNMRYSWEVLAEKKFHVGFAIIWLGKGVTYSWAAIERWGKHARHHSHPLLQVQVPTNAEMKSARTAITAGSSFLPNDSFHNWSS